MKKLLAILYLFFMVLQVHAGVVSTSPASYENGVSLNSDIIITFSTDINTENIEKYILIYGDKYAYYEYSYHYDKSSNKITITPYLQFSHGEKISVSLLSGLFLESDNLGYGFSFYTAMQEGVGTFVFKNELTGFSNPRMISSCDFNKDRFADFVINNDSEKNLHVYSNMPNGSFFDTIWVNFDQHITGVGTADLNQDNYMDIIFIHDELDNNGANFYAGFGGFSFEAANGQQSGEDPAGFDIGDINNDGRLDIVTANKGDNTVSLLKHNGYWNTQYDFKFTSETFNAAGILPVDCALEDVDNDGFLDILVINKSSNNITIYLNSGNGSFSEYQEYSIGSGPVDILCFDYNNDGFVDILSANSFSGDLTLLLNENDGTFSTSTIVCGENPVSLYGQDFDTDNDIDFVVVDRNDECLLLYENRGNATFTIADTLPAGNDPVFITGGDLYNDGTVALMVVNSTGSVYLYKNELPPGVYIYTDITTLEVSGDLEINYNIINTISDTAILDIYYSCDKGMTWQEPSIEGLPNFLVSENYTGSFTWKTNNDLYHEDLEDVLLKLSPMAGDNSGKSKEYCLHIDNNCIPEITLGVFEEEMRDTLYIPYEILDEEQDTILLVTHYMGKNSTLWKRADIDTMILDSTQYSGVLVWPSKNDLPDANEVNVKFKATPYDKDRGTADETTIFLDNIGTPRVEIILDTSQELSGDIPIEYTIYDEEYDSISLDVKYKIGIGINWHQATIEEKITDLDSSKYRGTFHWKSKEDIPSQDFSCIYLTIQPYDNTTGNSVSFSNIHIDNNELPAVTITEYPDTVLGIGQFKYEIQDTELDCVGLGFKWSSDSGKTWFDGKTTGLNTRIFATEYSGTFEWLSHYDFGFGLYSDVILKIEPFDIDTGNGVIIDDVDLINRHGDFSGDGYINNLDLTEFALAWNSIPQDVACDIGPASGTVPNLTTERDGIIDFEDLMVFIQMWNWSFNENGFTKSLINPAKKNITTSSLQLIQRPIDKSQNDIFIIDVYSSLKDIMVSNGKISVNNVEASIVSLSGGGFLKQEYKSTPLFKNISHDSSYAEIAIIGLDYIEGNINYDIPLFSITLKSNSILDNLIDFDYTLINKHGEAVETSRISKTLINELPAEFSIRQNYPNPFNCNTVIEYAIPEKSLVCLEIYDLLGHKIRTLVNEPQEARYYRQKWNGRDDQGELVASGFYFYKISISGKNKTTVKTQKMLMIR